MDGNRMTGFALMEKGSEMGMNDLFIKIKYYIRRIRWLWNHRDIEDCSRKFRMMEYDIKWNLDKR